jgi:hypothetical protein
MPPNSPTPSSPEPLLETLLNPRFRRGVEWLRYLGCLAAVFAAAAADAALEARLSNSDLAPSQVVTLILSRAEPLPAALDLTPLTSDFLVLEQRRAQTTQTVNGQRRERHELILRLMPRRTGDLQVPSLTVGEDVSAALPLTVRAATSPTASLLRAPASATTTAAPGERSGDAPPPPEVDVSASITPTSGVVGQEFILSIRASSPQGLPVGRFIRPEIPDASVLRVGERRAIDAAGNALFELKLAIYPRYAGELELRGLGFDVWQPLGGAPQRRRAPALTLMVSAPPAMPSKNAWIPARNLRLTEGGPSEVRIAPGQAVERVVTLRADGLSAEQLPALPLEVSEKLRVTADPPRLWNEFGPEGVIGYRSERLVLVLAETGRIELPPLKIDWWDTGNGRMREAKLPAWTLTAAPFASEPRRAAPTWRPSEAEVEASEGAPATPVPSGSSWGWLLIAAAALIAAALFALLPWRKWRPARRPESRRQGNRPSEEPPVEEHRAPVPPASDPSGLDALPALRAAYAAGDAQAARTALLDWARMRWRSDPPRNLSQLILRLSGPLREDVKLLDKAFYGPSDDAWRSRPVPKALEAWNLAPSREEEAL